MKIIKNISGIIFAFCLIIVCLFTAIECVAYWIPGYFPSEYAKYDVYETVKTEPEELDRVTEEMMDYLIGDRELLSDITATVNGVPDTTFFNERECAHMEDVRLLFAAGMKTREVCAVICLLILIVLFIFSRSDMLHTLAGGMITGSIIFTIITAVLGYLFSQNFTKYFIIFHEMFFDNDMWLLDPATDRLICIVPEGFFFDTVRNIIIIFAIAVIILLVLAIIYETNYKKKSKAA